MNCLNLNDKIIWSNSEEVTVVTGFKPNRT